MCFKVSSRCADSEGPLVLVVVGGKLPEYVLVVLFLVLVLCESLSCFFFYFFSTPVALVVRGGLLRACAFALPFGGCAGADLEEDAPSDLRGRWRRDAGSAGIPAKHFKPILDRDLCRHDGDVSLPPGSFDIYGTSCAIVMYNSFPFLSNILGLFLCPLHSKL